MAFGLRVAFSAPSNRTCSRRTAESCSSGSFQQSFAQPLTPRKCYTSDWQSRGSRRPSCARGTFSCLISDSMVICKIPSAHEQLQASPATCTPLSVPGNCSAGALQVNALDAAMPFDFESRATTKIKESKQLTIGIVGFGTFGQFLAKRLVQHGHKVTVCPAIGYSCL